MIEYRASDIIDAAMDVADLQNSNFISHTEKLRVLNECFYELYQHCISSGDRTWLKTFETMTTVELPSDFLQLESVTFKQSGQALIRKGVTESPTAPRYDITNSKLVIYGSLSEPVVVSYWPTPITLMAPDNDEGYDEIVPNFTPGEYRTALGSGTFAGLNYDYDPVTRELRIYSNCVTVKGDLLELSHTFYGVDSYPVDGCCYTSRRTIVLAVMTEKATYTYSYDIVLNRSFAKRLHNPTYFENETNRILTAGYELGYTLELRDDGGLYVNGVMSLENVKQWTIVNDVVWALTNDNLLFSTENWGREWTRDNSLLETIIDIGTFNDYFIVAHAVNKLSYYNSGTFINIDITIPGTTTDDGQFTPDPNYVAPTSISRLWKFPNEIIIQYDNFLAHVTSDLTIEKIADIIATNIQSFSDNYVILKNDGTIQYTTDLKTLSDITFTVADTPTTFSKIDVTENYIYITTVDDPATLWWAGNDMQFTKLDVVTGATIIKSNIGAYIQIPNTSTDDSVDNAVVQEITSGNILTDTSLQYANAIFCVNGVFLAFTDTGIMKGSTSILFDENVSSMNITDYNYIDSGIIVGREAAGNAVESDETFTKWTALDYDYTAFQYIDEPTDEYKYYYINGGLLRSIYYSYIDVDWSKALPLTCGVHDGKLTAWIEENIGEQTITVATENGQQTVSEPIITYDILKIGSDGKAVEQVINLKMSECPNRIYDVEGFTAWGTGNAFTIIQEMIDNSMMRTFQDKNISAFYGATFDGQYCVIDDFGDIPVIRQWLPDTLLNYPNAMFYPVLEYMMAIRFKMKQGDADGMAIVQSVLNSRLDAFYKSIPRDQFGQTRINNFYTGGYL